MRRFPFSLLVCVIGFALLPVGAQAKLTRAQRISAEAAGYQAYLYGYAPVYMNRNVLRFPQNMILNVQYLATDQTRSVILPNADTLYTLMVLDVGETPIIVETPELGSRYFGLELLDGYTNVFGYIGSRATGTHAKKYALVGPKWSEGKTPLGEAVDGVIRSSTPRIWVIGRTLVDGAADLDAAKAIQNGVKAHWDRGANLTRLNLSAPGPVATPQAMKPTSSYFKELADVLQDQTPPSRDNKTLKALAHWGIGPGKNPMNGRSREVKTLLVRGLQRGAKKITTGLEAQRVASAKKHNGWILFDRIGDYGTDYLTRAIIAEFGLGANKPQEAIYPAVTADYSGKTLTGKSGKIYQLHFPAGGLPTTINGFWSVTLYGSDKYFAANSLNRFAIGDRSPDLTYNPDGSLDLWVSHDVPPSGTSNWLPSPDGTFSMVLRVYRPGSSILNNTWIYPKVQSRLLG